MRRKTLLLMLSAATLVLQSIHANAQQATAATHIPKSEIMAAYLGLGALPDQQARVVDIGDGINVAVGILQRNATNTEEGEGVTTLTHHNITEVYYVLSGSGLLVTGGDIQNEREIPANSEIVRELVGPSAFRTVTNGETMVVSEGDVVVIPAGIAHGFSRIVDQVTYLSIRVDADQVLPAGYKHPLID